MCICVYMYVYTLRWHMFQSVRLHVPSIRYRICICVNVCSRNGSTRANGDDQERPGHMPPGGPLNHGSPDDEDAVALLSPPPAQDIDEVAPLLAPPAGWAFLSRWRLPRAPRERFAFSLRLFDTKMWSNNGTTTWLCACSSLDMPSGCKSPL